MFIPQSGANWKLDPHNLGACMINDSAKKAEHHYNALLSLVSQGVIDEKKFPSVITAAIFNNHAPARLAHPDEYSKRQQKGLMKSK